MDDKRGYLNLPHGKIWYRIAGKKLNTPLLVLHGGPGGTSDYLWNLDKLSDEREIIFYDQLGGGRSDRPSDPKFWTVDYFVQELISVRQKLNLDEIHLFGHSWGTMLATDYLFTKPKGVKSVVFSSPCISIPRWVKVSEKHLSEMPGGMSKIIKDYEQMGKTEAPEYIEALALYKRTYERRVDLPPKPADSIFGKEVYNYMWGPTEYTVNGTLKDYDHSNRLSEIKLPALFTCGKYDSASPEDTGFYQSHVPGAKLAVFENSSHMPHREEEGKYLKVLREFLRSND